MSTTMTDAQREEWSRHYDEMTWRVIPIFSAGVGALVLYSFDKDTRFLADVGGQALIFFGLLYVSSFRRFRARLHGAIENDQLNEFLTDPSGGASTPQWSAFVATMFAANGIFAIQLGAKTDWGWTFLCLLLGILYHYLFWKTGQPESSKTVDDLAMNMEQRAKTAFRATQLAQERMQDYLQGVSAGVIQADRGKAEQLARGCEETFNAWMAACREFTVH